MVLGQEVAGQKYLLSLLSDKRLEDENLPFPSDEIAPFLKVALFNAIEATKGH
jgi:hypothetical protein